MRLIIKINTFQFLKLKISLKYLTVIILKLFYQFNKR